LISAGNVTDWAASGLAMATMQRHALRSLRMIALVSRLWVKHQLGPASQAAPIRLGARERLQAALW